MSLTLRAAAALLVAAALAACSGSIGNGGSSALPNGISTPGAGLRPVPNASATPNSATAALSIGSNTSPQPLPAFGGYSGTVTFPAAEPMPSPSSSAKAVAAASPSPSESPANVSATVLASVVRPSAAPEMQERQKHGILLKRDSARTAASVVHTPLYYITIDPTRDVHLPSYPVFAFEVPAAKADGKTEFGLALFDPTEKTKHFRLEVAERDLSTPSPSPSPSASPAGKTVMRTKPSPAASAASPAASSTPHLTHRVAFLGGSGPLVLKANKAYVFALYSFVPTPAPSESPVASGSPAAATSPATAGRSRVSAPTSASASAAPSPTP